MLGVPQKNIAKISISDWEYCCPLSNNNNSHYDCYFNFITSSSIIEKKNDALSCL